MRQDPILSWLSGHTKAAITLRAKYERTGEIRWLRAAISHEKHAAAIRRQIDAEQSVNRK